MEKVDPRLRERIVRLGAAGMKACYSCGHCSAVCPLSEGAVSFPRKMIRYSMLGLEKKLSGSLEPWLCYSCGECTDTCPRDADPAGLMSALRRFATRRYSAGRIADAFQSFFASGIAFAALSLLMTVLILIFHDPGMNREETEFLSFMSLEHIHDAGLAVGFVIGAAFLLNILIMARVLRNSFPFKKRPTREAAGSLWRVMKESFLQRRFVKCEDGGRRRWAHLALFWGFAGMFAATILVMGIDYEYWRMSRSVPFIFGSVFGVIALYGAFYFIQARITRKSASYRNSTASDWIFLSLIVLAVLSGFVMDLFKVMGMPMAAYVSFAFHLVVVFDLLISLPFTKFAHMIYRPVALWLAGVL
ncbi:MAG: 4Fe-4S dicluster domain-containing protein [Candidatus Krumholzibacteria bacterium]|jgi:heterodisulfide reductase subunit C/nitrate reductase gamma subunit|nr:4Fe-4S dicluster domain-containing protein [Candidatus Krumholzibacteria bacterium]